jgi:glycosylphosphatidylinositol deacylase
VGYLRQVPSKPLTNLGIALDSFLAFGSALTLFIKDTLLPLLGFLTAASLVQSIVLATHLAAYTPDSGHPSQTSLPPSWVSDLLLGNKSASYLFLAAFIVFSCVGAVVAEYAVLQSLVGGAAWVVKTFHQKGPKRFRSSSPG